MPLDLDAAAVFGSVAVEGPDHCSYARFGGVEGTAVSHISPCKALDPEPVASLVWQSVQVLSRK